MHKLSVEEMHRIDIESFKKAHKTPLVIVLDNIRSLHNVGSVFRTADAFRIEAICLCGITGCPPLQEIHKTALGAEDSVLWKYFEKTADAVRLLQEEGYEVCALEQVEGSTLLQDVPIISGKRYALVFGNEVKGVNQEIVDIADRCVEIPQYGTKHSLNVSVTAGIAIWEFSRKLDFCHANDMEI